VTTALSQLAPQVGVAPACAALGLNRATYYRRQRPRPMRTRPRPSPLRTLSTEEKAQVLEVLDSERFVDEPVRQVYAQLLDEQVYLCSPRTMYRILTEANQVCDRRRQRRHPTYVRPELVATKPNQVWSWDITKLPGPAAGLFFNLYVMLDIFSRYVVGWRIAPRETKEVTKDFLAATFRQHGIAPGQLACHSDRGVTMVAKSTVQLYSDLGIASSFNRPRVSNDNPYSEAAFKTLKYHPTTPERFGSVEDARVFFAELFAWYNERHRHSSLALLTPGDVHHGRATAVIEKRQRALDVAYQHHPERFVARPPTHPQPPAAAWINPPPTTLVHE
jgi:putative transposase